MICSEVVPLLLLCVQYAIFFLSLGFLFCFVFVFCSFGFLFCFVLFCFVLFLFFWDRVSLCSPGWPGTHFVDQGGLELRNPLASASRVLGLKAWATTTQLALYLLHLLCFFWGGTVCRHYGPITALLHSASSLVLLPLHAMFSLYLRGSVFSGYGKIIAGKWIGFKL